METIVAILMGILTNIITELSKKYNISQTYVIFGLVILLSTIYQGFLIINPGLVQNALQFGLTVLGTASGVYMFITKFNK